MSSQVADLPKVYACENWRNCRSPSGGLVQAACTVQLVLERSDATLHASRAGTIV